MSRIKNCITSITLGLNQICSFLAISSKLIGSCRLLATQNCITAIPLGVDRICPFVDISSKPIANYRLLATQATPGQQETYEDLSQIFSAVENDPVSSKEIFGTYMEKLCRTGNLSDAARLLEFLRDKQVFLNSNTYNILLLAAGEGNDFGLLTQIFKDLLRSCESLGRTSYSYLAKAFFKSTDHALLLKLVREVSELTFPRNPIIINRILAGFAESRQIDKALLIYDHLKNLKCKPDVVTYNTVLAILGRAGRVDEMLHEFVLMKEAGMVPDIVSYNTLINGLRKVGRLDLCFVFLQEMSERGLEPDLRTYTALIDNLGRSGRVEESLTLFNEMKRKHIPLSVYIYRSLISTLKKAEKLVLAMSLLEEMKSCASDLVGPKDFKRKNS